MAQETKVIQGIKVSMTPEKMQDWDVMLDLAEINDCTAKLADLEQGDNDFDMLTSRQFMITNKVCLELFGQKQFDRIKAEFRKRNDGVCNAIDLTNFISKVFTEFQAKN